MGKKNDVHRDDTTATCPICDGLGMIEDPHDPARRITCPRCGGRGRVRASSLLEDNPF